MAVGHPWLAGMLGGGSASGADLFDWPAPLLSVASRIPYRDPDRLVFGGVGRRAVRLYRGRAGRFVPHQDPATILHRRHSRGAAVRRLSRDLDLCGLGDTQLGTAEGSIQYPGEAAAV